MRLTLPVFLFAVLAAAAAGFGVSNVLDRSMTETLKADLEFARDCRKSGATLPPCPVEYKNTRIEWREKIETVQTPDPKQSRRIAALTEDLADARQTVRDLERRRVPARAPRLTGAWWLQNGTISRPFNTDDRCAVGTVIVYEAAPAARSAARTGDPNVCYVRKQVARN